MLNSCKVSRREIAGQSKSANKNIFGRRDTKGFYESTVRFHSLNRPMMELSGWVGGRAK